MPLVGGVDASVWFGAPDEKVGPMVVLLDEVVDGGLQGDHGMEGAALELSAAQLGEEAFDGVEPGGGGRREMEGPTRVAREPSPNLRMLVHGIVVEDHVDRLALGYLALDGIEETDEFLVAMPLHVAADDRAIEDIERREQCRRPVPLVIMSHRAEPTALHRQPGLCPIECLDLRLFVDRQHHRMFWRIDVEAHNVLDFLDEGGIVGELELPPAMRHQARLAPDHMHLGPRHTRGRRHRPDRPVRPAIRRRILLRPADHVGDFFVRKLRNARRSGLVAQQTVHAFVDVALLPAPDRDLAEPGPPPDLVGADPITGQQHYLRPPDVLLRAVAVGDDRCQSRTIRRGDEKSKIPSHRGSVAIGTQMSKTIH